MRRSALLALVVACLAASCGGGGDDTTTSTSPVESTAGATSTAAGPESKLLGALAGVRDTPGTAAYVEWSDVDGVYAAAGVAKPAPGADVALTSLGRWMTVTGFGAGPVAGGALRLREEFGIDPLAASQLLTTGEPPDQSMRITGAQDAAAIGAALRDAGGQPATTPGGASVLAQGEEGEVDLTSPFAALGVLTLFNRIALVDGDLVASSTGAGVDLLLDPSPSLADAPGHRAVARCLSDPVAALLLASDRVTGTNGAAVLGVGVLSRGGDVVNVVCVAGDAAGAATREAALRAAADPETVDPRTNERVGTQVASSTVTTEQVGDLVVARAELVLQPDVPAAYIVQRVVGTGEAVLLGAGFEAPGSGSEAGAGSSAP